MQAAPVAAEGLLLIDKPAGMTSHDVVDEIRRRFRMRRVGHGGTLDPAATGLLILLLGRATRHARVLLGADKTYVGTLLLGQATDTQDAEGKVLATREVGPLTRDQIEQAFAHFRGPIEQEVPAFSAVRIQGRRFYDLARAGQPVPRRIRKVTVHELRLLGLRLPEVDLEVTCSSGTYVRTLCADLGSALGCGGHLKRLSRTQVGPFRLAQAVRLEEARPEHVIPADRLMQGV
ncbi:MAG: tRNA pseudouridine(55) synthase TruB [Candidatus Omnitrophica bacterium]|nr:tRNA pseudouridine(55) synthase TruB [Candidatus Omnitrophota bacterium]